MNEAGASTDDAIEATAFAERERSSAPAPTHPELPRGAVIGRYVIVARIGRGAMGVVYAAYDPELDRKIALKLLNASERARAQRARHLRLLREAQALARLSHPNVVTVHDVGEHEGDVFVAMEFIEGRTLSAWLTEKRPKWPVVVEVFVRAGRGLQAAHAKAIVHGDFKPDNVMLDEDGRVRVMDFGLARAEHPSATSGQDDEDLAARDSLLDGRIELTQKGALVGTPAYMAPEQLRGERGDAASDQFAFCVSLWQALYGRRPFVGDTLAELTMQILGGRPSMPPGPHDVPRWLRRIVERGMKVDPGERWPSLTALCDALQSGAAKRRTRLFAVGGVALITAGAVAFGSMAVGRERRRARCETEADAITEVWNDEARHALREGLLGSGAGFAQSTLDHAVPIIDAYAARWRERHAQACIATTVQRTRPDALWPATRICLDERRLELAALLDVLSDAPSSVAVMRAVPAVAGLRRLEPCSDEGGLSRRVFTEGPDADALRERLARADALGATHDRKGALAILESLTEDAEHTGIDLHLAVLMSIGRLQGYQGDGDLEAGARRLTTAVETALAVGQDDVALEAVTLLLHNAGYRRGRFDEAESLVSVGRGLVRRLAAEDDVVAAALYDQLGILRLKRGEYEAALAEHDRARAIWERELGPEHPFVGQSSVHHGNVYMMQGRYEQACEQYERVLAIREQTFGHDHPEVADALNNLGAAYNRLERYELAVQAHERALAIRRAARPDHPEIGISLLNLGNVHYANERLEPAREMYEQALTALEQARGREHPDVAVAYANLGAVLGRLGDHHAAESALVRAIEIHTTLSGTEHPQVALARINLGHAYNALGRHEQAEEELAIALALLERAHGDDHPEIQRALIALVNARVGTGRYAEAIRDAERALARSERLTLPDVAVAEAKAVLASALWEAGHDRARARELAQAALVTFSAAGQREAKWRKATEQWLLAHPLPRR